MATTTNFGWDTPDDTDLVKDGAAAIRTLGSSIDSSFVDLKGGTTGQVLSKASNTDLDFNWVAVDPLTILDAKGDLISATAADTPTRLAVGANETRLVAASSEPTGLKYVADTTNYAISAKGDLLAGTASDTLAALGVGANGTVLTADSAETTGLKWVTPSSGGMTSLASGTLSGSQVDLTSISSGYKDLILVVRNFRPNTDSQTLRARFNSDTGNSYQSNEYNVAGLDNQAFSGVSNMSINGATDSTTNNGLLIWQIYDYANATTWKMSSCHSVYSNTTTVANFGNRKTDFFYNSTDAITAINLFPGSGDFAGGTYILYGVK
jgi:hypothetical protein